MDIAVAKKMTYAEYREIDFPEDGTYYELLNGEIVARNSPSAQHQEAVKNLIFLIELHIRGKKMGKVFPAPLDVKLDDFWAPQPDVLYIREERLFILDNKDEVVYGAPDLVVEVISPTSIKRDRSDKMEAYEQFGVREYWVVDPKNRSFEVWLMQQNRLKMASFAAETGKIASSVIEGLEIEVADVF